MVCESMMNYSKRNKTIVIKGLKTPVPKGNRYVSGDVVFAEDVPFEGNAGSKSRPVVFLGYQGKMARYVKCTTSTASRIPLIPVGDPISAGLGKDTYIESVVRYIEVDKLNYCLGHLSEEDLQNLREHIAR